MNTVIWIYGYSVMMITSLFFPDSEFLLSTEPGEGSFRHQISTPNRNYFKFSVHACSDVMVWLYSNDILYLYEIALATEGKYVTVRDTRDALIKANVTAPDLLRWGCFFVWFWACGLVDRALDWKSKAWGSIPTAAHSILPLHNLVDKNNDGVSQAGCILVWHVHSILVGEMWLLKWCVSYTREGNWSVEYGTDVRP